MLDDLDARARVRCADAVAFAARTTAAPRKSSPPIYKRSNTTSTAGRRAAASSIICGRSSRLRATQLLEVGPTLSRRHEELAIEHGIRQQTNSAPCPSIPKVTVEGGGAERI